MSDAGYYEVLGIFNLRSFCNRFTSGSSRDKRKTNASGTSTGASRVWQARGDAGGAHPLSRLYLVRHGQAGTREAYDSLSALGKQQARLLGEHFVREGIQFAAAFRGENVRQAQTGDEVQQAFRQAGAPFPEIACEPRWNEFDLDHIYRSLAPAALRGRSRFRKGLCGNDCPGTRRRPRTRRQCASPLDALRHPDRRGLARRPSWVRRGNLGSISGTCRGESPDAGPGSARRRHRDFHLGHTCRHMDGLSMDVADARAMRLAGAVLNASYTVLRLHDGQLRLQAFNAIPHLTTPQTSHLPVAGSRSPDDLRFLRQSERPARARYSLHGRACLPR